jgi:hypothetical protein
MENDLTKFALDIDKEEIVVPTAWLTYIDQILSDDALFNQVALHGEILQDNPEAMKKAFPLRSTILNFLPDIRNGLLDLVMNIE